MIKTILFDLGGVILTHSYEETFELLSKSFSTQKEEAKKIYGQIKEDWALGKFDIYEAAKKFKKDIVTNLTVEQLVKSWQTDHVSIAELNKDVVKVIKKLKKKYKVYLLSNTTDLHYNAIASTGVYDLFDGAFTSFKLGMLKPSKNIYEHVIKKLKIKPQEAIFIDDKEENVEGARKVGINGILFRDYQDLIKQLKKFGV